MAPWSRLQSCQSCNWNRRGVSTALILSLLEPVVTALVPARVPTWVCAASSQAIARNRRPHNCRDQLRLGSSWLASDASVLDVQDAVWVLPKISKQPRQQIEVEGWVRGCRVKGKTLAFVDIFDGNADASLSAVLRLDRFEGALLESTESTAGVQGTFHSEASFPAYVAMCKPGAFVRFVGVPDSAKNGEIQLQVHRATLLACAPNPQVAVRLLREACEGSISRAEATAALLLHESKANMWTICGQLGSALRAPYAEWKHLAPSVVCTLQRQTTALRKALPHAVDVLVHSGTPTLPDISCMKECSQEKLTAIAAVAQQALSCGFSPQEVPSVAAVSRFVGGSASSAACSKDVGIGIVGGLFVLVGLVRSRRRFTSRATLLTLVDKQPAQATRADAEVALRVVLHPGILAISHPVTDSDGIATRRSLADAYGDLFGPGSQVQFTGVLLCDEQADGRSDVALYATSATLKQCSWQPRAIRNVLDYLVAGQLRAKEVANALGLPAYSEERVRELASLDSTGRQWAASDISAALQGPQTRATHLDPAALGMLDALAGLRSKWPAIEEARERLVVSAGSVLSVHSASAIAGSRWARAKRPQIEWMASVIEELITEHPEASSRPLHVVDVGGGQGLLASRLAERFGSHRVALTVLELGESHATRGRRRADRRRLSNLAYLTGDASKVCLDARPPDLVVALHACGTLTDVALEMAARHGAAFCVCMCCFRSNLTLRVGGRSMAEWLDVSPSSHLDAVLNVASLLGDSRTAAVGMHTVAALRAEAVLRHWRTTWKKGSAHSATHADKAPSQKPSLRIARFPEVYSRCNFCLVAEQFNAVPTELEEDPVFDRLAGLGDNCQLEFRHKVNSCKDVRSGFLREHAIEHLGLDIANTVLSKRLFHVVQVQHLPPKARPSPEGESLMTCYEALALYSIFRQGTNQELLELLFCVFDVDADDRVSSADLEKVIEPFLSLGATILESKEDYDKAVIGAAKEAAIRRIAEQAINEYGTFAIDDEEATEASADPGGATPATAHGGWTPETGKASTKKDDDSDDEDEELLKHRRDTSESSTRAFVGTSEKSKPKRKGSIFACGSKKLPSEPGDASGKDGAASDGGAASGGKGGQPAKPKAAPKAKPQNAFLKKQKEKGIKTLSFERWREWLLKSGLLPPEYGFVAPPEPQHQPIAGAGVGAIGALGGPRTFRSAAALRLEDDDY